MSGLQDFSILHFSVANANSQYIPPRGKIRNCSLRKTKTLMVPLSAPKVKRFGWRKFSRQKPVAEASLSEDDK